MNLLSQVMAPGGLPLAPRLVSVPAHAPPQPTRFQAPPAAFAENFNCTLSLELAIGNPILKSAKPLGDELPDAVV